MSPPDHYVRLWLGPLIAYDTEHRSQLVRTLSMYLRSADDVNRTAATLGIQRSTARFRLTVIRKLTGLDVRDPGIRLALMTATDLWLRRNGSRGHGRAEK